MPDVGLSNDDEDDDGDAKKVQPAEEEQERMYDIPDESPLSEDFIDQEPSESDESEDDYDNSADEPQAIPEQLRFLALPRRSSQELQYLIGLIQCNSKYK